MTRKTKVTDLLTQQVVPAPSMGQTNAVLPPSALYQLSQRVDLPPEADQLSVVMQDIARQLITTKRRIGKALLEAAHLLAEARTQAEHGQWLLLLRVTSTSEDTAQRLLNIFARAQQYPPFGEAVERGWLSESSAWRLAPASVPTTIIDEVLSLPEAPSVREIEQRLRAARSGDTRGRAQVADSGTGVEQIPPRGGISATLSVEHDDATEPMLIAHLTDAVIAQVEQSEQVVSTILVQWQELMSKTDPVIQQSVRQVIVRTLQQLEHILQSST